MRGRRRDSQLVNFAENQTQTINLTDTIVNITSLPRHLNITIQYLALQWKTKLWMQSHKSNKNNLH